MKKFLGALTLSAGAVLALAGAPAAGTPLAAAEDGRLWFVELAGSPVAAGGNAAAVQAEKAAFRRAAAAAGARFSERRSFDVLFNGFSVDVGAIDRLRLARVPGVKAMYPVAVVQMPTVQRDAGLSPELETALEMTGAGIAQTELGLTGAGVKVAVMDTGIDYHHPDLGGCFGPGCRVAAGWDFVGDAFNADSTSPHYNPVPTPDNDPDDCQGHGTHVAGIVGANGLVRGVAPGVTFGAYRVFGCDGSTTADIMVAAMERALADGMQVLNMSIGAAFNSWPQYPTAQAADRLVNKGMVVVASIGNSGTSGVFAAGAPGVGKRTIGVASFDNTHINALTFRTNPAGTQVPYLSIGDSAAAPTSGTSAPLAYLGRGCPGAALTPPGADDAYLADPNGKVALIDRGACTFDSKYQRAVDAGAVAVVVANNAAGLFVGGGIVDRGVPAVGVSLADGNAIKAQLEGGAVTLTWTDERVHAPNPTGGVISSFSSYGLAADLSVKPNIGAPGGLIRSTYPLEKGGYVINSGTSMASPHVAGGVALLLQAHPKTSPESVKSRLQNAADPKPWQGNPGLGFLDQVHRQGAGMLDIGGAITAQAVVTPSELALGESESGPASGTLTIRNVGAAAITYDLSHAPALSTVGSTFAPGAATGFASVAFSAPSVAVPAGGTASFDVTVTANPGLADRSLYGGYLVLTPQGGGAVLRVPYAGFKGDYQSIQVIPPTTEQFPFPLVGVKVADGVYDAAPATPFSMADDRNIPYLLVHLRHQTRHLRIEVIDANTGKSWQRGYEQDYLPRNATSTGFFALPWDGITTAGKGGKQTTVPNGTYVLKLSVLKALGDSADPAHWETWTSPPITVARP